MSGASSEVTRVKIYNQSYDLKGENPDQIRRLASLLDEKMKGIADFTPTVDTVKIVILAALNIADDYFAARDRIDELEAEIGDETERLIQKMSSSETVENPESSDATIEIDSPCDARDGEL